MEVMEKPYEIFNAVRDRFRKVSPVAVGFPLSVRHNVDFNEFRFGLDREHQGGGYSTLNVKKANVPFAAIYDPTGPFDPMMTLDRAAWIAILEGPLKGRQLYIDPREEAHIRGVLDDESMSAMAVRLSLNDGPDIPGLELSETISATSWKCFVPESAESKTIELAFKLQRERRMYASEKTQRGANLIESMLAQLSQSVAKLSVA